MAVISVNFFSNSLKRTIPFIAIIPNDGEFWSGDKTNTKSEKFKTLYLLHGFSGDETDYLINTRIRELSHKYNIAVIMPTANNGFYLDSTYRMENYGEFIGEELVEYTRRLFNLSSKREDTFIAGLSMGGYGAMRNGLKYNETFSKIASYSGAYVIFKTADAKEYIQDAVSTKEYQEAIFGEFKTLRESDKDPRWLIEELIKEDKEIPEIFITIGKQDFLLDVNKQLKEFSEDKNINFTYIEDEGQHDWDFWNKYLEKSIEWIVNV